MRQRFWRARGSRKPLEVTAADGDQLGAVAPGGLGHEDRIGKEYVQGNLGIVVEFDPAGGGGGSKGSGTGTARAKPRNFTACAFLKKTNLMAHRNPDGGGDDGMLVGIVEDVQPVDFLAAPCS
jgi:hypothetical protein